MGALLNFVPPEVILLPADGRLTTQAGLAFQGPRACYVCHEIGSGDYYAYLWGKALREYFELPRAGHMLATNLHADDLEQAREQVCGDNAVGYWVYTGSTGKPGYARQVPGREDTDAAIGCEVPIPRTEIGYEQGLAWEPDDGHLVFFDDYYYGRLASLGERLKEVIGLEEFARYPGTPAEFLEWGKRGENFREMPVRTRACNGNEPPNTSP